MAFLDTLTVGGGARGALNYQKMMEAAAAGNEYLANANYIEQQQNAPAPVEGVVPGAARAGITPPPVNNPTVTAPQITILPRNNGVPFTQNWGAPGIQPPTPPTANAVLQPGMRGRGQPSPAQAENPWITPPYTPLYGSNPAGIPSDVPVPQAPLAAGLNTIFNFPHDVVADWNNGIMRPIGKAIEWAVTTPTVPDPNRPTAKLSVSGTTPAKSNSAPTSPAAKTAAAAAGLTTPESSGASSSPDAAGTAGVATPSSSSTPAIDLPAVRKEALRATPADYDFFNKKLMDQRQQIADDANAQIAAINQQRQQIASVAQAKISRLTQDAAIAQRTGNIGLMKSLQSQAEDLLSTTTTTLQTYDQQTAAIEQLSRQAFRENDQNLWNVQAMRAERNFVVEGDPSLMLGILDQYGQSLQLEDAGDGKFYAIDLRSAKRLTDSNGKAKAFTRDEFANMFHSTISDEFRQQQAAAAADNAKELFKTQLEIMKQSANNADQAKIEMLKKYSDKYTANKLDDGTVLMVPENMNSGLPTYLYNPDPQPIPGSSVTPPKLTEVTVGG